MHGHHMLTVIVSCPPIALDWRNLGQEGRWGVDFPSHKHEMHFSEMLPF